ncbi:type II toxin-antitoxin system RelE/ParE family toxin [Cupriavidus nantongensis]|uniref:type II toxin-antitoxin system RelE/ParE family toxin n=1 Tax=Cupriavidus nantongensis TaxID=1796606 RepID=UPI00358FFDB0
MSAWWLVDVRRSLICYRIKIECITSHEAELQEAFRTVRQEGTNKPLQLAIEDEVEELCAARELGEAKIGDLGGIRVHKFRFNRQQYLIAYRALPHEFNAKGGALEVLWIDFYKVGSHENFYDELKKYLKAERNGHDDG